MEGSVGYSHHHGPPRLWCSAPWALTQLRTLDPEHPAVLAAAAELEAVDRGELTVAVDWLGSLGEPVELLVREQGHDEPIAIARFEAGEAGSLCFRVGAPGTLYVSELRPLAAAGGAGWSRTLHVLAPFPKAWRSHQRVCFTCLSPSVTITLDELHALARPIDCGPAIDRGFGLELELLSVPADTDAGHFSKVAELHALLNEAERVALAAPDAQLATLVRQIRRWQVSLDPACLPFPLPTATLLLPRMRAMGALSDEDALLMLSSRQRTTPTEYKSALPPHELCFSSAEPEKVREGPRESGSVREGPRKSGSILGTPLKSRPCARAEIALGLRLISKLGVSAPSVRRRRRRRRERRRSNYYYYHHHHHHYYHHYSQK
ncbi:hypothetical protein T492DRAFT_212893 [Pavlovales sp. CCMP2436]|nr:hypothetical protein T492DRAFT_212893 [Pavlovales sp. CCMP2436]